MIGAALELARMKIDQYKGKAELEEIQERALSGLVAYAAKNVPFYRKRLAGKGSARLSDLPSIPITTKEELRADPDRFISADHPKESLVSVNTSGSSGMQTRLYRSKGESAYGIAFEANHLTECGIGPFMTQARIADYSSAQNLLQRIGIMRCSYLDVREDEAKNFEKLRKLSPDALISYPSVLLPLSRLNAQEPLRRPPKAIFTSGEILSAQAREAISSSFGCPVYDRYGTVETSFLAWECGKGSMHVDMGGAIVEIVDSGNNPVKDGVAGDILITPLWRRSMPLIRYRVGDRASFGPRCRCGRGLSVIKAIEGREDDFVVLPSGKTRSARSINIMDDIRGILSYQIVQERPELFVFRFVPQGAGLSRASKDEVARRIRAGCLGEDVSVEFEGVPSIGRGKTGKRRAVISKVAAKGPV